MYRVILETKWNLRLEHHFPGFRKFCYVRKKFITPCNRIADLQSSICCCPWLTGHSRKLSRGFPDYLCEVSHCSPLTDGRQSILYIGLLKIPEHVYGSHCSSNHSSISGCLICSVAFGFLFFMLLVLLICCCNVAVKKCWDHCVFVHSDS